MSRRRPWAGAGSWVSSGEGYSATKAPDGDGEELRIPGQAERPRTGQVREPVERRASRRRDEEVADQHRGRMRQTVRQVTRRRSGLLDRPHRRRGHRRRPRGWVCWFGQKSPSAAVTVLFVPVVSGVRSTGRVATNVPGSGRQSLLLSEALLVVHGPFLGVRPVIALVAHEDALRAGAREAEGEVHVRECEAGC